MKQYDVITIGEALIDFIPSSDSIISPFLPSVGGAPLNVAVGVAKLGGHAAMIGRVGRDPLGKEILCTLQSQGVNCSLMQEDDERHTTVTLVMPTSTDMQRYIIYRDADYAVEFQQLPEHIYQSTNLVHLGVLLNISKDSSSMVLEQIRFAKAAGAKISLDINMRPGCWKCATDMIAESKTMAKCADIIKLTREEKEMMDLPVQQYATEGKIILITDGERDIHAYWHDTEIVIPVQKAPVIDVTGAGDAFLAAFLYTYCRTCPDGLSSPAQLQRCVEAGMRAGSYSVQRTGAHTSYPKYADIFE